MNQVLILGPARSGKSTAGRAICGQARLFGLNWSHGETSRILKEIYWGGDRYPEDVTDAERQELLKLKKKIAEEHGESYLINQLMTETVDGIRTWSEFEKVQNMFEQVVWILREGCVDETLEFSLSDALLLRPDIHIIINDAQDSEEWAIKVSEHARNINVYAKGIR